MKTHSNIDCCQSTMPNLGEQLEYWNDRWDESVSPNNYQLRRGKEIISLIEALRLNSPKIMDIGCGTGWFTAELKTVGKPIGIDLSDHAIEKAKKLHPDVIFMTGNLYEKNLPENSFDVVVAMEVIPHVEDQKRFIDIIDSILKPGGYLVLSMVNKFAINRAEWDHGPNSHIINWLSMGELKKLFQNRYRIIKQKTIMPIGNKGILRIVNSFKLNRILRTIFSEQKLINLKERLGLGYTRLILAQKAKI